MKLREVVCKICGSRFTTKASLAKYCCDECRKIGHERQRKMAHVLTLCDTKEMQRTCLNCTRPSCGGECEFLARVERGEA